MIKAFGIDFGKINGAVVINLMRVMAIPSFFILAIVVIDVTSPPAKSIDAKVIKKYEYSVGKGAKAKGVRVQYPKGWFDEEVSDSFFNLVQSGDALVIKKSKFFGYWKEVVVTRKDQKIGEFHNMKVFSIILLGGIFLIPLLSFTPLLGINPLFFGIPVVVAEAASVILCVRFVLVWAGIIGDF